jgi:protease I
MSTSLNGKTIAFLVATDGVEQVELTEPWEAVEQAGGTPELVSTEVGKIQAFNHLTPADTFEADKAADSVSASDYAALVLPGGVANPDVLRANWVDDEVVECSRGPNTLVSSRQPDDLPAFCNTLVGAFARDKS